MIKTYIPPLSVRMSARKARECLRKGSNAGTRVGKIRSWQLATGKPVSLNTIKRMYSFFSRHHKNKNFVGKPCKDRGYVAWNLWGGDAGFRWAKGILGK